MGKQAKASLDSCEVDLAKPDPLNLGRVLVVDDCAHLTKELEIMLRPLAAQISTCSTIAEAREVISTCNPELVLLDHCLPDGTSTAFLEELNQLSPKPIVVGLSGSATPDETFQLARRGMTRFLPKPFKEDDLMSELRSALTVPPDITPQLRDLVGRASIKDTELLVRATMVDEALAKSGGSRRGAARLLDISRQMLQQVIRLRRPVEDHLA